MEGCFAVEEDINFDNFLKMFYHDDEKVQKMIENSKQVTLTENPDGTWTINSGLKTSTFPLNKEFKETWDDNELTGFITMEGSKMSKMYKHGEVEVMREELEVSGSSMTLTLLARDGTKAVRKMKRV